MSTINKDIVLQIENHPKDIYLNAVEILLKLINNVIREPENEKYRTIRLENKIIKEKLLSVSGIDKILTSIGFELNLNATEYKLPADILIGKLKKYRDFIAERKNEVQYSLPSTSKLNNDQIKQNEIKEKTNNYIIPSKSYLERISFPRVLSSTNPFLQIIEKNSDHVMQYEDDNLRSAGKALIPICKLNQQAIAKLKMIQKAIKSNNYSDPEPCLKDLILVELVNWFNCEFFEWINVLPCKICGKENIERRVGLENGVTVEIGKCCGQETKFFRYNDIEHLLVTRKGRCGEYANCFTFFCRCLDYDARYIFATFDHVWTEVYSIAQNKWLHVDPSDNVVDSPLMYQHGWKRNVDYIIAFSKDDIQDVTWRYSSNHKYTLSLRKKCTEEELIATIVKLRKKRHINISKEREKYIVKRILRELVELIKERNPNENEKKGRSSGSLMWRQDRGEQNLDNYFVFANNDIETFSRQFNLRYSCTTDKYDRFVKESDKTLKVLHNYKGWESTSFSVKNIFRKVENDWKMAYLARREDTDFGEIIWKFDFTKQNLKIKNFSLKFDSKKYENGLIELSVKNLQQSEKIEGSSGIILKVTLSGGKGDNAWQHAQIFRQDLNSNEFPFELNVNFY